MKILLDPHILLWLAQGDSRLPGTWASMLRDGRSRLFLSDASVWEICIKYSLKRLDLPEHPHRWIPSTLARQKLEILPIHHRHILRVTDLPFHHHDPFDRLLVAQAIEEDLPLMTCDTAPEAVKGGCGG